MERKESSVKISIENRLAVIEYTLNLEDPVLELVFEENLDWIDLCARIARLQVAANLIQPRPVVDQEKVFITPSGRSHA